MFRTLASWKFPATAARNPVPDSQQQHGHAPIIISGSLQVEKSYKNLFLRSQLVVCESSVFSALDKSTTVSQNDTEKFFDLVRAGDKRAIVSVIRSSNLRATDDDSWTCLHWAVEMGHKELVELFLDADPLLLNMKTREGLSCINIAAWRGDVRMVQLLLDQGAEIDDKTKWGETPLHHAVTFGHAPVCEALLKAGADPHTEDRLKRTPFQIAMQKGTKQVKQIFSRYAPPSQK